MKLTVFTPTYNRAVLLDRLFHYLVSEKFNDMQWIIVDDGSTDETKKNIKNYKITAPFEIKYLYQENSGKHIAFNRAIESAEGQYFICIDSDDIYTSDALKELVKQADLLLDKEEAGLCYLAAAYTTPPQTLQH